MKTVISEVKEAILHCTSCMGLADRGGLGTVDLQALHATPGQAGVKHSGSRFKVAPGSQSGTWTWLFWYLATKGLNSSSSASLASIAQVVAEEGSRQ